MNKLEDVKYKELKVMIPEYLYDSLMQTCKKLYGKKKYRLKCYERLVTEFINNHAELRVEKGEPLYD